MGEVVAVVEGSDASSDDRLRPLCSRFAEVSNRYTTELRAIPWTQDVQDEADALVEAVTDETATYVRCALATVEQLDAVSQEIVAAHQATVDAGAEVRKVLMSQRVSVTS